MSTNSLIGKLNEDGSVTYIYCHWDGYLDGVGQELIGNYNTEEKVSELIASGDHSSLVGVIMKYSSKDEPWDEIKPKLCDLKDYTCSLMGSEYVYLFSNGAWYFKCFGNKNWYFVDEALDHDS